MKHVLIYYAAFCFLSLNLPSQAQITGAGHNRKAAFAGSFYPADRTTLSATLNNYFGKAKNPDSQKNIRAIIVPHAGYAYSGEVLAAGYNSIPPESDYENIFIIASSHRISFKGASVYAIGDYETPLGIVEVNRDIASDLIENNKNIEFVEEAHLNEHSIEVQLPMIQYHFIKNAKIVPIVIGEQSPKASKDLALALLPYFAPENLFVISSDFSHYPPYKEAVAIDKTTCNAVLSNSPEIFYNTLRNNSEKGIKNLATSTCGWTSILTLLYMTSLDEQIEFEPLLYRNSGDAAIGDKERVVGYWAIAAYTESEIKEDDGSYFTDKDKAALLKLSRTTLVSVIKEKEYPEIDPSVFSGPMRDTTGAFVTLYMNGRLRGCIGQFEPVKPLYMVIQEMTAASALNDRRFAPVEPPELDYIKIEISLLTPLRKIHDISELEVGKHGIYIVKDNQSGTYLPQVVSEQSWSAEEFVSHCSIEKAGLGWEGWKNADMYVYETIKFGEK